MPELLNRISFDEFSKNLARIFDRVIVKGESVVIEKGEGELVALSPISPPVSTTKTEEDWAAFQAAAGSWADVDSEYPAL